MVEEIKTSTETVQKEQKRYNKGLKLYRTVFNDGVESIELVRIINNKNPKEYKVMYPDGTKSSMTPEELRMFTILKPAGVITFNVAVIKDLYDVIVTLHRTEDIEDQKIQVPFVVCRQNITDFFTNTLTDGKDEFVGVSVSVESIPVGIDMNSVLACDGVTNFDIVDIYLDDTLGTILSMVKSKEYDNVLYTLFANHVSYKLKGIYGPKVPSVIKAQYMSTTYIDGYCKYLKDLLVGCNFMYDVHTAFKMLDLNIDLTIDARNGFLNELNRTIISRLINKNIEKSIVVEYDYTIDLQAIAREYVLVSDSKKKVYIVGYIHSGKYHIPIEEIESVENISKMHKIHNLNEDSSLEEAFKYVNFNKDKYANK